MPCSISEGPQEPDDAIPGLDDLEPDEDRAYELRRQADIDDGDSLHNTLQDIASSPDPSGPLGECRYNCPEAEHVGNHKYVCLHPDHWEEAA